ncbi:MAG: hypothetical protein ACR2IJ_09210 [Fluviibacter sp.]
MTDLLQSAKEVVRQISMEHLSENAVESLRQAISEAEQADHFRDATKLVQAAGHEPYAWVSEDVCDGQFINGKKRKIWWECIKGAGIPFYTAPPQREWVSLTDDEIEAYEIMGVKSDVMLARAIEAKLKEKNS